MGERNDLVEAVRECEVLVRAALLAEWVGEGRPVTAKGVLRRADVPEAGRMLVVDTPAWVRTAADLPELHWPWVVARSCGYLTVDGNRALPGPALAGWSAVDGEEVLDRWTRALAAVLADMFVDGDDQEVLELGRRVLEVLATEPAAAGEGLFRAITTAVIRAGRSLYHVFDRGFGVREPAEVVLGPLAAFGAVETGPDGRMRITPLGRHAMSVFAAGDGALLRSPEQAELADRICQLKITLRHVRPACWRRVLVPASVTLGALHEVIQVAFAWDGDHLHGFTVGRRHYGDPGFDFEFDEDAVSLAEVFGRARGPISYVYDFGDTWLHEIELERAVEPDPAATYPVCVQARGDAPVEDHGEGEPLWIPLDQQRINTDLAGLAGRNRQAESRLLNDLAVILTDVDDQLASFEEVLAEEVDFPLSASLLGAPVVVTAVTAEEVADELRAHCRGERGQGTVSFADLEFPPETVAAWLHAVYLMFLGRRPAVPDPPVGWELSRRGV